MTVAPDERSNPVFSSGTPKGSRAWIPIGGQTHPRLGEIVHDLCNNAHKNERKNKISETINRIIPIR